MNYVKNKKLRVAILGSGNIGTDLLFKILRSPFLECSLFIGRQDSSSGIQLANKLGISTSTKSINAIIDNPNCCEVVFDATSAKSHRYHAVVLRELKKWVIDLTPSNIGEMIIPAVRVDRVCDFQNINMVSCGGQASIPIAYLLGQTQQVEYIEVVSSIASKSAGPATRSNMDEYIETTEAGLRKYSGCEKTKSILILNPATPPIYMQTTISAKVSTPHLDELKRPFGEMVRKIQSYVPGYEVVVPPTFETNRIVIMVRVAGRGDFLPKYSGNLDIINCAAIAAAERFAQLRFLGNDKIYGQKENHY